ncbi:hypothetical protein CWC17_13685 [Pseudoalteromonas sp. S3785]|uniref:hypothetical protein n=1 Tax=Pseudoalteromonas sp. S3785 TaxID=579545 RepID=UPI00110A96AE|nr:hypothetical protein [Pseudoalteromonas sp. S3785]TMO72453.1 hypothetical protein CWC17_13685 [Pseudoalteromonas sp. S3785]
MKTSQYIKGLFMKIFGNLFTTKQDFTQRVMTRYEKNTPTSNLAKSLFSGETKESINARFAKAKKAVEEAY